MTDTPRCEPPDGLRGVDGWHVLMIPSGEPELDNALSVRYVGPFTTPAEVDGWRAECASLRETICDLSDHIVRLGVELTTLRATVARLVEALEECATDLSDYVTSTYSHPAHAHRLERDMAPVVRARAAIARAKGDGE